MSKFEEATRNKVRFETNRGMITVEDLWDLPLTGTNGFNLDNVAKTLAKQLRELNEESFVTPSTKASSEIEDKLDIVKHIIEVKIDEAYTAKRKTEIKAKKQVLLNVLAQKENEVLYCNKS